MKTICWKCRGTGIVKGETCSRCEGNLIIETRGQGWHGDPQGHSKAGQKGGRATSSDRGFMSQIGKKGGAATAAKPGHMAEIGRRGGEAASKKKEEWTRNQEWAAIQERQ